jgi:hypothetical protein
MDGSRIDDRSTTPPRHSPPSHDEAALSALTFPSRTLETAALHEIKSPKLYLLLENSSKANNLGTELRCAAAFGVEAVVLVGFDRFADYGSHGASKHVRSVAFPTVDKAIAFVRGECGCESIVGMLGCVPGGYSKAGYPVVESSGDGLVKVSGPFAGASDPESTDTDVMIGRSYPIASAKIQIRNTCVVICKQTNGLPTPLGRLCGCFTHVPHLPVHLANDHTHSSVSHASFPLLLNQPSLLSITLCRFTELLGFTEHSCLGHKYEVSQLRKNGDDEQARKQRLRRSEERIEKEKESKALADEGVMVSLFCTGQDDIED